MYHSAPRTKYQSILTKNVKIDGCSPLTFWFKASGWYHGVSYGLKQSETWDLVSQRSFCTYAGHLNIARFWCKQISGKNVLWKGRKMTTNLFSLLFIHSYLFQGLWVHLWVVFFIFLFLGAAVAPFRIVFYVFIVSYGRQWIHLI